MLTPIDDPLFYLAAVPAVLIAGIGKGGFGGSVAMLATPLIALTASPIQAAAIMLPILCTMDILGLAAYRTGVSWRNLATMVPGAVLGIGVGALTFDLLDENVIRIMLGGIALLFTANRLRSGTDESEPTSPNFRKGGFWGALSGFTSFVAHAGGPPVQMYLLPQRLDKTLYVGTSVWFFFIVNYVKLIPYSMLGQFTDANLGTSLVLVPLAPVGIWMGIKLHSKVNERWFYRIIYFFLIVAGVKLMIDGVSGLLAA